MDVRFEPSPQPQTPLGNSRGVVPASQPWWLVSGVTLVVAAIVYTVDRYRLRQLLEVERIRTRIAADLHDDIGANLSKLILLSEVAEREAADAPDGVRTRLQSIAAIARESVDSMADIVWAVDPRKDRMDDLVRRMRRFAEDAFAAQGTPFTFEAPPEREIPVGADVRREVLLVFKEAVNNVVRHADCRHVRITLDVAHGRLTMTIEDNGRGFEEDDHGDGHGLWSMRQRIASIGGTLAVTSRPRGGTRVSCCLPVTPRTAPSRRNKPEVS